MSSPPEMRSPGTGSNQSGAKRTFNAAASCKNEHSPSGMGLQPPTGPLSTYPGSPGSKGPDGTSQDAANAIAGRVSELRKLGLVESTGERRRNPSGQSAAVQRITSLGLEVLK